MVKITHALLFIFICSFATGQIINSIAGRGTINKNFAIGTESFFPGGITFDSDDNAYITDRRNHVIYRVDGKTNIIRVIAGTTLEGYSGDGGLAIQAKLKSPGAIVMDSKGNIIFADTGNNVIRMITPSGYISTIAGDGTNAFKGNNVPAEKTGLEVLLSLAIDKEDNIYLPGINRILKINSKTRIISTVAGNGQPGFAGDNGPAIDAKFNGVIGIASTSNGDLYIADNSNFRLRKISASTGIITTVGGNGTNNMLGAEGVPATSTQLSPTAVSIDSQGGIYVTEASASRVRKIDTNNIITDVSGKGVSEYSGDFDFAKKAGLDGPNVVAFDSKGNIYIVESKHVRKITSSTNIIETFGGQIISFRYTGDGNISEAASLHSPFGLAISDPGDIYISESDRGSIRKIDAATNIISTVLSGVFSPSQLLFGSQDELYFAEEANHTIKKLNLSTGNVSVVAGKPAAIGSYGGDGGLAVNANFWNPRGMALDNDGNLIICDIGNNLVRKVDKTTGIVTTIAGTTTKGYAGDGGLAINAKLNSPRGIAIDATGDIYITDSGNQVIRKIEYGTGIITTAAGTGVAGYSGDGGAATTASMLFPEQLALDKINRVLYCIEYGNHVIRKIDLITNVITTYAGTGISGYSGDLGPANNATFNLPRGIALDKHGNVYASDGNNTIRKIQGCLQSITQPATVAQAYCFGSFGQAQPLAVNVIGSGTLTYQWYSNNSPSNVGGSKIIGATLPTYTPNLPQGNWYYVAITSSCGIFNSSVSGLAIGINVPKPTISSEVGTPLLMSSPATSYQWYFNGSPLVNATEKNHEPTMMGNYSVKTSEGSCQSEMSDVINVMVTGLDNDFPVVEVYPNPAIEYLNINTETGGTVQISNLCGDIVLKAALTKVPFQLNISELASGMYLLKISGSTQIYRFVKQ